MAKYTTKKYLGDDLYSWTLFKDGRPILTGLSRREAIYYKKVNEKEAVE